MAKRSVAATPTSNLNPPTKIFDRPLPRPLLIDSRQPFEEAAEQARVPDGERATLDAKDAAGTADGQKGVGHRGQHDGDGHDRPRRRRRDR